jgi:tartrate-resistant acid phosphatase type 5
MKKTVSLIFSAAVLCFLTGCNPDGIFYEFKSFKKYDAATVHNIPSNLTSVRPIEKIDAASLSFFAVGCAGSGNQGQVLVAKAMGEWSAHENPEFVLYLGDNFYGRGVSSVNDSQWQSKFEDIYDSKALALPFYAVLGNHDQYKNPEAQIEYSKKNSRWKMPAHYYSFEKILSDGTKIQFFGLDTTPIVEGKMIDQARWLEEGLRVSTADWKVVFGHHPVYSGAKTYLRQIRTMRHLLEPLFKKYKVDLYVAAHNHSIEVLKNVSGVNYVVSGAGSRPRDIYWTGETKFAHADLGFAGFRIFKTGIQVYIVNGRDGKLIFQEMIPREASNP